VLRRPVTLLEPGLETLRSEIIAVSDVAFGTDTSGAWREKFSERFLSQLARFYLLEDDAGELIGWSGYRAKTVAGERVVYFASTGLLPSHQGLHLVPTVQRMAVGDEARRHPTRPVTLSVRTRSPVAYRLAEHTFGPDGVAPARDGEVPAERRAFARAMAAWIGPEPYDPVTSVVSGAYHSYGALYGEDPHLGDAVVDALFGRLAAEDALIVFGRGPAQPASAART
jgi:hypothetical protein